MLAKGIAIDDYEERVEKFDIRRCWEWLNGEVLIYELPSMPHEVVIGAVAVQIITRCVPVQQTDAEIYSLGSTSKYYCCYNISLCLWHRINFYFLKEHVIETVEKKPMHHFVR